MTTRFYPILQWHDSSGDPLVGGTINTYIAGTTTPKTTYTDRTGGTPNANPVVLDAQGGAQIWMDADARYKLVVKDSSGTILYTLDEQSPSSETAGLATLTNNIDVNGYSFVSTAAGDITLTPDTTGDVIIDGLKYPQADGTSGQVIATDGAGQLSFTSVNIVGDTTPQLGGSLDVNGQSIVSASAGNIAITPDTTGDVIIDGLKYPQADGTAGQFLQTDGSAQLSWAGVDVGDLSNGTDGELITWDASGVAATVAVGTSGQVLTSNGAGAAPTFQGAPFSPWTEVSSVTASASANISFTGMTAYTEYLVQFEDILPATDGVTLNFQVSSDNGSTYETDNYTMIRDNTGTSTVTINSTDRALFSSVTQGNNSTEELNGQLELQRNVEGSLTPVAKYFGTYESTAGAAQSIVGTMSYISTFGDVDAVRFSYSSGNIASGTCRLFGR